VLKWTNRFNIQQLYALPTLYVFVLYYLRTNSDLCHLEHKLVGFYNRDEKCLQRGTDWGFKYSGLRFVFKGLMGRIRLRRYFGDLLPQRPGFEPRPFDVGFFCSQNDTGIGFSSSTSFSPCIIIWHIWYDIFNCNWVATRWQLFSTHIHTNNTENDTKQTIHKTTKKHSITQKIHRTTQKFGGMRVVPRFCVHLPGICLTIEEKHGKTSVRVATHKHTIRIHSHTIKMRKLHY
jgi:hypothetical protein